MNLLLFLSDRCNMTCDYCFLSLNDGPAVVLKEEDAKRAVDEHLARHPGGSVTALGGEPLLYFDRLEKIAAAVRRRAPLKVVTNGALACPEKLGRLEELGASVTFSLDGAAGAHDRHRKLLKGGSSHGEALAAIESRGAASLSANMVVCGDTAGELLANVEALRSAGFRRLSFHLNVVEPWTAESLKALERALAGLARYRRTVGEALELTHLSAFAEASAEHDYDDVVLGADGRYYPCDALFSRPYRELGKWAVGDARSGVDWKARGRFHAEAKAAIHGALKGAPHYTCPRETYYHALLSGRDAAEAVRSFHAADSLLAGSLLGAAA